METGLGELSQNGRRAMLKSARPSAIGVETITSTPLRSAPSHKRSRSNKHAYMNTHPCRSMYVSEFKLIFFEYDRTDSHNCHTQMISVYK